MEFSGTNQTRPLLTAIVDTLVCIKEKKISRCDCGLMGLQRTCACIYEQLHNLRAVITSRVVEWSEPFLV